MRTFLSAVALFFIFGSARGAEPAVDLYGDPLPPEAIARLGSTRLRVPADAQLAFSADGKVLLAFSSELMQKFDPTTGQELSRLKLQGGPLCANVADYHPRLERLVSVHTLGLCRSNLYLHDTTTGKLLLTIETPHWGIASATLSPDGKFLATARQQGGRGLLVECHQW